MSGSEFGDGGLTGRCDLKGRYPADRLARPRVLEAALNSLQRPGARAKRAVCGGVVVVMPANYTRAAPRGWRIYRFPDLA